MAFEPIKKKIPNNRLNKYGGFKVPPAINPTGLEFFLLLSAKGFRICHNGSFDYGSLMLFRSFLEISVVSVVSGDYLVSFFLTPLLESNTNQDIGYGLEILNTSDDASKLGTTIRSENSNHVKHRCCST